MRRAEVGAEDVASPERRFRDPAIDLSAGRRLLVDEHDREAVLRAGRRGGKSGGPRADHDDVVMRVMSSRVADPPMPSATRTRHACTLRSPSIVTTQSKHAPIMHNGPRGVPETAVARKARSPAASIAAATESPSRAVTAVPST